MVRSALPVAGEIGSPAFGFNSTMVRSARCRDFNLAEALEHVSIPRWFDQHVVAVLMRMFLVILFQFHDGSISTRRLSAPRWTKPYRFNSTMVRSAPDEAYRLACDQKNVSIPRWFDQHSRFLRHEPQIRFLFQFHDGSISTRSGRQCCVLDCLFQFHDGSISTLRAIFGLPVLCLVSIPRWFDQHHC